MRQTAHRNSILPIYDILYPMQKSDIPRLKILEHHHCNQGEQKPITFQISMTNIWKFFLGCPQAKEEKILCFSTLKNSPREQI